jgi:hypothetical protein
MNIIKHYLILAVAAGFFCTAVSGQPEQLLPDDKPLLINQPHPALDGIDKVHVAILQYGNTPDKDVPFWKQLKANVKEKLRRIGIESETPTADNILSIPELRIYISTLSLEDSNQRVFHIRMALARTVCLKNKRNPVFKSDIWQANPAMQIVSSENMPDKVTDVVLEQLESFIHQVDQILKAVGTPAKRLESLPHIEIGGIGKEGFAQSLDGFVGLPEPPVAKTEL